MSLLQRIFDKKGTPVLGLVFIILLIAEERRRLRIRTQSRNKRLIINTIVAIPAFTLLRFLFLPIMVKLARKNASLKFGVNYQYNAFPLVKGLAAFLILDYTNYLWHILNHKVPLLWRFHLVHHTDLDLDVATAFRFHFGELIGSVFYRGAFVFLSGASASQVLLYEILFEAATQFHHSNLKLPLNLEKALNLIIVTPRMHGIHHSMVRAHADSNYSVIFSFWDRIHHTAQLNINQAKITIGVPSYADENELTIGNLLQIPFTKIRNWENNNYR